MVPDDVPSGGAEMGFVGTQRVRIAPGARRVLPANTSHLCQFVLRPYVEAQGGAGQCEWTQTWYMFRTHIKAASHALTSTHYEIMTTRRLHSQWGHRSNRCLTRLTCVTIAWVTTMQPRSLRARPHPAQRVCTA